MRVGQAKECDHEGFQNFCGCREETWVLNVGDSGCHMMKIVFVIIHFANWNIV